VHATGYALLISGKVELVKRIGGATGVGFWVVVLAAANLDILGPRQKAFGTKDQQHAVQLKSANELHAEWLVAEPKISRAAMTATPKACHWQRRVGHLFKA